MNLFVLKHYKLSTGAGWIYRNRTEGELNCYSEMRKIAEHSGRKHINDLDDVIVFTDTVDDIQSAFQLNFSQLHQLWSEGHSVFYCDLDTIVFRPISPFSLPTYSLFNYANRERSQYDKTNDRMIDPYLNCGVRYQPATMKQSTWELGFELWERTTGTVWDYEQMVYNYMLQAEVDDPHTTINPRMNYLIHEASYEAYKNVRVNSGIPPLWAFVLHFQASRATEERLEMMRATWCIDD